MIPLSFASEIMSRATRFTMFFGLGLSSPPRPAEVLPMWKLLDYYLLEVLLWSCFLWPENCKVPFLGVKFFISKSFVMIESSAAEIRDWSGLALFETNFERLANEFLLWMISSALPCIVKVFPVLVGP